MDDFYIRDIDGMILDKIKGHDDLIESFEKKILEDGFEGAYLFKGPKGVGKYTTARLVSKRITCSGVQDESCRCNNCKSFPDNVDYLEIRSSTVIKVEDIDSIDEFVSLMPYGGRRKSILIDDADRMNSYSSNKILKTLEDLPEHVVVFLISSNPDNLIPTVRSRAKHIEFDRLSFNTVVEILKSNGHRGNKFGEFKRALPMLNESILENYSSYSYQLSTAYEFLDGFSDRDEDDIISYIKNMDEYSDLPFFLDVLLIYLSDILRIHLDDEKVIFNSERPEMVNRLTFQWSRDICVISMERLKSVMKDYKTGLNLKIKSRLVSALGWIYMIMQQEKKKNAGQEHS